MTTATGGIEVRERSQSDLEETVAALREVHLADRYPVVWPADPARWLTPSGMTRSWVAAVDGRIVGHVLLRQSAAPGTAELARLFVAPAGRGLGLGARLLDEACARADEDGLALELEVVAEERSRAIALYENAGWRRVGTEVAEWTAPDGAPVMVYRYVR